MHRDLAGMDGTLFDLLVVGGGIHGVCAARDAASRGLSVALVEKGDFGGATSANSLKILHGGLRYLQQADFRRMRQSFRERSAMMRLAPHLSRPLPVVIPTYPGLKESRAALGMALRICGAVKLGLDRAGEAGNLPAGRILDRTECLKSFPWIRADGLTGAALWYDGQAVNSERLTLSFLLSAAEEGAQAANRARVTGLLREGPRIIGARILDEAGGQELEIRARVVLNAAGPWGDSVAALGRNTGSPAADPPVQALAVNLVSRRFLGETALGIRSRRGPDRDPVGGGGRHLFLAPWRGRTLIGTSYRTFRGEPGREGVTEADLRDLLEDCNEACPGLKLAWDDVVFYHGGVLPLRGGGARGGKTVSLASEPRIVDHRREEGVEGMVSIIGVKYTTARLVAEKALDLVFRKLGKTPPPARTLETPLWGGDSGGRFDLPAGGSPGAAGRLREIYGSRAGEVAKRYRQEEGWDTPVSPGCAVRRCEVLRAVREEMALKLEDVALRRTDLGTAGAPTHAHLAAVARLMAKELGWGPEREAREIEEVTAAYAPLAGFPKDTSSRGGAAASPAPSSPASPRSGGREEA